MRLMIVVTLLALPGCATTTAERPGTSSGSGATCTSAGLDAYVGRKATVELGAELLAKSGARLLRWGPPDSAMTMDFREDRLTVSYDGAMMITRLTCG